MNKRILSLDILRIISSLMVLSVHIGENVGLKKYTDVGAYGVQLFFILSGYLAMASCRKLFDKNGKSIKEYYVNRAIRILPMYYWILFLDYICSIYMYHNQGLSYSEIFNISQGPCGINYLRYVLFLQYVLPSNDFSCWNNRFALWSMSAFAFFYLLAPLIYKVLNDLRKILAATIILLLLNNCMTAIVLNMFSHLKNADCAELLAKGAPINQLCIFLLGCSVFFLKDNVQRMFFGISCLLIVVVSSLNFFVYELVFTACLIFAISLPIEQYLNDFVKQVVLYLSEFTFCLYLSHPIIIGKAVELTVHQYKLSGWIAYWLIFVICILFSMIIYNVFIKMQEFYSKYVKSLCV